MKLTKKMQSALVMEKYVWLFKCPICSARDGNGGAFPSRLSEYALI